MGARGLADILVTLSVINLFLHVSYKITRLLQPIWHFLRHLFILDEAKIQPLYHSKKLKNHVDYEIINPSQSSENREYKFYNNRSLWWKF